MRSISAGANHNESRVSVSNSEKCGINRVSVCSSDDSEVPKRACLRLLSLDLPLIQPLRFDEGKEDNDVSSGTSVLGNFVCHEDGRARRLVRSEGQEGDDDDDDATVLGERGISIQSCSRGDMINRTLVVATVRYCGRIFSRVLETAHKQTSRSNLPILSAKLANTGSSLWNR